MGWLTQRQDIVNERSTVWDAIRRVARTEKGIDLGDAPRFAVTDLGDGDFRIDSPLADQVGLEEAHLLTERAILAVAGTNIRVHQMKQCNAVTGFRDDEFAFFDEKIRFLMRQMDPNVQEERLDRVVAIAGLPGLSPLPAGSMIDAERLLRLRESDECREFRTWLRNLDSETDEDIAARFADMRGRIADVVESSAGRIVRFTLTTGVGLVPVAGPGRSLASAADTFLVERVLGQPGPAIFLSQHYPSIFS